MEYFNKIIYALSGKGDPTQIIEDLQNLNILLTTVEFSLKETKKKQQKKKEFPILGN